MYWFRVHRSIMLCNLPWTYFVFRLGFLALLEFIYYWLVNILLTVCRGTVAYKSMLKRWSQKRTMACFDRGPAYSMCIRNILILSSTLLWWLALTGWQRLFYRFWHVRTDKRICQFKLSPAMVLHRLCFNAHENSRKNRVPEWCDREKSSHTQSQRACHNSSKINGQITL